MTARAASVMLLNKVDLLPYLQFDVEATLANAHRVNPRLQVIRISALSGEGFDTWIDWLVRGAAQARAGAAETVESLRARVAVHEARPGAAGR